jgi:hypothetical protein
MAKKPASKKRPARKRTAPQESEELRKADIELSRAWAAFCKTLHAVHSPDSDSLPTAKEIGEALEKARKVFRACPPDNLFLRAWEILGSAWPQNEFGKVGFVEAWQKMSQALQDVLEPASRVIAALPRGEDAVPYFLSRIADHYDEIGLAGAKALTHTLFDYFDPKPRWDADRCALYFKGQQVRKYHRVKAKDLIRIIEAFEELGWPARIDSPLPAGVNLREKVRELNREITSIRFASDGKGEGIAWHLETL